MSDVMLHPDGTSLLLTGEWDALAGNEACCCLTCTTLAACLIGKNAEITIPSLTNGSCPNCGSYAATHILGSFTTPAACCKTASIGSRPSACDPTNKAALGVLLSHTDNDGIDSTKWKIDIALTPTSDIFRSMLWRQTGIIAKQFISSLCSGNSVSIPYVDEIRQGGINTCTSNTITIDPGIPICTNSSPAILRLV